jgi:hypothetical protein
MFIYKIYFHGFDGLPCFVPLDFHNLSINIINNNNNNITTTISIHVHRRIIINSGDEGGRPHSAVSTED